MKNLAVTFLLSFLFFASPAAAVDPETSQQPGWKDSISITIPARGDKEYGFLLAKGERLEYRWKTNGGKLYFDLHAEPAGDTTGYFESFKTGMVNQSNGSLVASFDGTHGWYWKNNNPRSEEHTSELQSH